jgi:hypothetical protein
MSILAPEGTVSMICSTATTIVSVSADTVDFVSPDVHDIQRRAKPIGIRMLFISLDKCNIVFFYIREHGIDILVSWCVPRLLTEILLEVG